MMNWLEYEEYLHERTATLDAARQMAAHIEREYEKTLALTPTDGNLCWLWASELIAAWKRVDDLEAGQ